MRFRRIVNIIDIRNLSWKFQIDTLKVSYFKEQFLNAAECWSQKYRKAHKWELCHVISLNLLGDVISSISRLWPSFKSFWWVQLKTVLYEDQTRGRILRMSCLHCINHWLKNWCHTKSFTSLESKYIELIFRNTISVLG